MRRSAFKRFLDQERAKEIETRRPPASLSTLPTCVTCGTSVEKAGDRCPTCEEKRASRPGGPVPSIVFAPQPAPAYAKPADETPA